MWVFCVAGHSSYKHVFFRFVTRLMSQIVKMEKSSLKVPFKGTYSDPKNDRGSKEFLSEMDDCKGVLNFVSFLVSILPLVSLLSKLFELLCRLQSKLQVYLIMRHCVSISPKNLKLISE